MLVCTCRAKASHDLLYAIHNDVAVPVSVVRYCYSFEMLHSTYKLHASISKNIHSYLYQYTRIFAMYTLLSNSARVARMEARITLPLLVAKTKLTPNMTTVRLLPLLIIADEKVTSVHH